MRVSGQCAAVLAFAVASLGPYPSTAVRAQAPVAKGDATAVLAAARQALGGDKKLSAVKTLTATGRTRQVRGDNLVPIEFEIAVELPDKYVRKDEIPAQESGPTSTGFNADELIQLPVPVAPPAAPAAAGRAGAAATPPTQAQLDAARNARVGTVKQDFVRLTLGMFAASFSSYPLTFSYVGQAEAPQGTADVVEAKGAGNFSARLFINSQTHLPIMVSWQQAAGRGGRGPGGGPLPARGGGDGRGAAQGPATGGPGGAPQPPSSAAAPPSTAAAPAPAGAPPTTAPGAAGSAPAASTPPGSGTPGPGRAGTPPAPVEN